MSPRRRGSRYMADYRDAIGKRVRKSGLTRADADAIEKAGREEARQFKGLPNPTFNAYAGPWLATKKLTVEPATYDSYEKNFRLHLEPTLGPLYIRAIRRRTMKDLLAAKLREGLKKSTVGTIMQVASAIFADALDDGLTFSNPAARMGKSLRPSERKRGELVRPKAMTEEQLDRFLAAAEGDPLYPFLFVMSRTGLRTGELVGSKWGDIDFVRGELRVERQWTKYGAVAAPKAGHGRTVELADSVMRLLVRHRSVTGAAWLAAPLAPGVIRGEEPPWIFHGIVQAGADPISREYLRKGFMRILRRAGLPKFTPHGLRHSYISQMIVREAPLKWLQEQVGISSLAMMIRIYGSWLKQRSPGAKNILDGHTPGTQAQESREIVGGRSLDYSERQGHEPAPPSKSSPIKRGNHGE